MCVLIVFVVYVVKLLFEFKVDDIVMVCVECVDGVYVMVCFLLSGKMQMFDVMVVDEEGCYYFVIDDYNFDGCCDFVMCVMFGMVNE